MRIWQQTRYGEPGEVLELSDVDDLVADTGDVVIEPEVVGISMPDLLLCRGEYQSTSPFPFTVGGELSGIVVAAPDNSGLEPGQRVMTTRVQPGGLAETVVADVDLTDPVPDGVSPVVAASIPVNYVTAHLALHHRARVKAGETVLVLGGAGGVGSAAIQLALAAGARVITTALGAARREACHRLGAQVVVEPTEEDVVGAVEAATEGAGADVIIDPVGGEAFDDVRRCVAFEGRVVIVGFVGGSIPSLRTNQLVLRNFAALGVNNGLYMARRPEVHRAARLDCLALAAAGGIDPLIAGRWPFDRAPEALQALAQGNLVGKAVVDVTARPTLADL
jgi:NADPH2:quinone reductase